MKNLNNQIFTKRNGNILLLVVALTGTIVSAINYSNGKSFTPLAFFMLAFACKIATKLFAKKSSEIKNN
jgi:hypothetical protein